MSDIDLDLGPLDYPITCDWDECINPLIVFY